MGSHGEVVIRALFSLRIPDVMTVRMIWPVEVTEVSELILTFQHVVIGTLYVI